jgi:succinyl-diaminopimelate desuccinylase
MVGEPTCPDRLGDMIKIGRRGSLNAAVTVHGTQGHVAYPGLADNPVPRLLAFLDGVCNHPLDDGTEHFPPSNLEITTIDVGNPTTNLIPSQASACLNIRFNDRHSGDSLRHFLEDHRAETAGDSELAVDVSGEAFLTPPGRLSEIIAAAIRAETGIEPELSTTGGTSDARFIKDHCPVAEFGMINQTAHKVDENVALADIEALARIYEAVLSTYFEEV